MKLILLTPTLVFIAFLFLMGCEETKTYTDFQVVQSGTAYVAAKYYESGIDWEGEWDEETWYEEASQEFWFISVNGQITETNVESSQIVHGSSSEALLWLSNRGLWNLNAKKIKRDKDHSGSTGFTGQYVPFTSYSYQFVGYDETYTVVQDIYLKLREAQKNNKTVEVKIRFGGIREVIAR